MALPPNLKFGTVTGQYLITAPDGADVDTLPDAVPASGTVTFTPSAGVIYSYDETNPVALAKDSIVCPLDSEGYICTPGTTTRGVKLLATDDETLRPVGWQWIVTYQLRDPQDRLIHDFQRMPLEVPADVPTNLIKAAPIAQSNGVYITKGDKGDTGDVTPELQSLVGQAATSASNAAGSASTATTQAGLASSAKADAEAARDNAQALHSSTVISGTVNGSGRLVLTRNDSTVVDAGSVVGPTGATGPATTLSVLETTTGVDYQYPGPQGPIGPKGDPGGWVTGTALGTTDLNLITTDGIYRQNSTGQATLAANYPVAGAVGVLYVSQASTASFMLQTYHIVQGSGQGRVIYERINSGAGWQPWRAFASSRVDQTAGRVIYQWDDLNNREQLIYGDTGWREFAAPVVANNVVSGNFRIRRTGNQVQLFTVDVVLSTAVTGYCALLTATQIPLGFRPHTGWRSMQAIGIQNNAVTQQWITNYGEIGWTHQVSSAGVYSTARPSVNLYGSITWTTDETWPTSLPGTAIGAVPNA